MLTPPPPLTIPRWSNLNNSTVIPDLAEKTSKFLYYFFDNINDYSSSESLYYYSFVLKNFSTFPQIDLPTRIIPYKKNGLKVKFVVTTIDGKPFAATHNFFNLGLYKHGKKLRTEVTVEKRKDGEWFAEIGKD